MSGFCICVHENKSGNMQKVCELLLAFTTRIFLLAMAIKRKPSLAPRKAPKQDRSAFMVEAILEAATRVLATQSLTGFNTNRVAEVAGVSIGSLYQYFPNKAALMSALIAREHERLCVDIERCVQRCAGLSLQSTVEALARIGVKHQYEDALLAAAIDHEEKRLPLESVLAPYQARMISAIEEIAARHHQAMSPSLPETAAQDCLVIAKALIESETASKPAARRALVARVTHAIMGYLTFRA
jgi:AcrR family transcriptional regulator